MSSRKGKKPVKDLPLFHDEVKRRRCVWFTDTAWGKLQAKAAKAGISTSELLEKIATDLEP